MVALEPPPLSVQLELQQTVEEQVEKPQWSSCVTYLRQKWDIPIYGDALFVSPNISLFEAHRGDVVIFLYGRGVDKSHVAMFDRLGNDGFWVWEYNRKPYVEEHRLVRFDDPALLGFKRY